MLDWRFHVDRGEQTLYAHPQLWFQELVEQVGHVTVRHGVSEELMFRIQLKSRACCCFRYADKNSPVSI